LTVKLTVPRSGAERVTRWDAPILTRKQARRLQRNLARTYPPTAQGLTETGLAIQRSWPPYEAGAWRIYHRDGSMSEPRTPPALTCPLTWEELTGLIVIALRAARD
jgi:hypothetical protein